VTPAEGRSDLPRGTVTLVFTDIESSTIALRTLRDRYKDALALHARVLREVMDSWSGVEVDTQGDAFFVAFPRAHAALGAVADLQRALAAAPWPHGVPLRVRVGLHTGEPELVPHGYVGIDVHRASRICGAAHGGQVLVSAVTRALATDGEHLSFVDLGRHSLQDIGEPERLFQLLGPGLETDFPPLRTWSATNLPTLSGPLIGRDTELEELSRLIGTKEHRLLTLVGPGGAGKSRLALEAGTLAVRRRDHGVYLVRLAPVEDSSLVAAEIARVLSVDPGADVMASLAAYLGERDCVLVLDNLEHLPEAAPLVATLIEAAPGLTVLATSRTPLRVAGERVLAVEPLPEDAALALFVERARAADSRFSLDRATEPVARTLCRRLSGLPLAIEIAAARVTALSVSDMVVRLEPTLETEGAARDRPERQRTLAATIDWSYRLLEPRHQELLLSLALFQERFTPDDAEDAFGATIDDLSALVAAALLRRADDRDRTRYTMLRIVREFLLDRLGDGPLLDAARSRRDAWLDRIVDAAGASLEGPDLVVWLDRLEGILPELRASLAEAQARGDAERCIRLVAPLERFWRSHAHAGDARDVLRWALDEAATDDPLLRAHATWTLGRLAAVQGDASSAAASLEQALTLFRDAGASRETVFALSELSWIALDRGELDAAERRADEALSLARAHDDDRSVSGALGALASVAAERGDSGRARTLAHECLAIRRQLGDRLLVANALLTLGSAALADGDAPEAESPLDECLTIAREIGDTLHEAGALCCLGEVRHLLGDDARAQALLLDALAAFVRMGNEPAAAECLVGLAAVAAAHDSGKAVVLLTAARRARARAGTVPLPVERRIESEVVERVGEPQPAQQAAAPSIVDAALAAGVDPDAI
jgi:predicted ATPase/class 3 adenylate cyclase